MTHAKDGLKRHVYISERQQFDRLINRKKTENAELSETTYY